MALVDFQSAHWAAIEAQGTVLCDVGGPGNTFNDPAGISFLIGEGSMRAVSVNANRFLFFTSNDCPGTGHAPHPATLVIRFSAPQQRVVYRIAEDPGEPPAIVWYYREHNRTDLVEQKTVARNNVLHTVHFDRPCFPVKEIVIRCASAENSIDYVEFGPSQNLIFASRFYCLLARLGLTLRDLVVTRQRPTFNWEPRN